MTTITPFDYDAMAQDASDLLTEFGQTITLRRTTNTGPAYAPTQTTTDYTAPGIVTNFPRWYSGFATPNSDVQRTDRMGLMAGQNLAIVPSVNDLFVDAAGTIFQIIDWKPINPAGTPLLYRFQLRI